MSRMEKHLLVEKGISSSKIRDAVEEAEMAFWSTIEDMIPEIGTSDLDKNTKRTLMDAMTKAVNVWVKYNV